MCLGVPQKVVQIKANQAKVQSLDHDHWIDLGLVEDVQVGDYLLSYQNAAINKIEPAEAEEILQLICQKG